MRFRILIAGLSFVMAPAFAAGPAAAPASSDPARAFVQTFYDWYVKGSIDSDAALKKKPAYFSPELTKALEADEAAAARSPDEVVGLDFDPFLNAQDICSPYKVGAVKQVGDAYEVEVLGSCADTKPGQPDVIARLVRHGASWMFVDFIYPARDGQPQVDLLAVLKALQQERDDPANK
jgi:hypothetical protein